MKEVSTICHCRKMRRITDNVKHFYDKTLEPAGVTVNQYGILREIRDHEECSVKDLAEILELDASTLARNVQALVHKGMVLDTKEGKSRRKKLVLTDRGREVCVEAERLWMQAQEIFESRLAKEELEALEKALDLLQTL